jgi:hypothetical protein
MNLLWNQIIQISWSETWYVIGQHNSNTTVPIPHGMENKYIIK